LQCEQRSLNNENMNRNNTYVPVSSTAGTASGVQVVLGASGGVGRALVDLLLQRGHQVQAVGRTIPTWAAGLSRRAGFQWVSANIEDPAGAVDACDGAATVYFAAQPPYGEWPERFPSMTANVINASAKTGAKLVMVDNLYMYGPTASPLHEDLPRASTGRKGATRARMEDQLLQAQREGRVRVTIGRLSDYYGPNGPNTSLAALVLDKALAGKAMQWPGLSTVPRTLHYLPDAARGLLVIGSEDTADGHVWHLPAAAPITGDQFMSLVNQHVAKPVKAKTISTQMMKIGGLFSKEARETVECMYQWTAPFVVDSSSFTSKFGVIETTPHAHAVRETLKSMLDNN
jgi:nucleoside-diphosphate-sugar epimerase